MLEIILVVLAMAAFKGYTADIVIDAGDDMPSFVSNALRNAGVIPRRIPLADIMKAMLKKDKKSITPQWIRVYVD